MLPATNFRVLQLFGTVKQIWMSYLKQIKYNQPDLGILSLKKILFEHINIYQMKADNIYFFKIISVYTFDEQIKT